MPGLREGEGVVNEDSGLTVDGHCLAPYGGYGMEVERIFDGDGVHSTTLALLIRGGQRAEPGLTWVTENRSSLQLGFHRRPAGHVVAPHVHHERVGLDGLPQEFLLVQRGRMRVDFYTDERQFVCSRHLGAGDCLLLVSGGHAFEMLEETELLEVKSGPYVGQAADKTRFEVKR